VDATRTTSIATGALLIVATVAAVAAAAFEPALTGTDYLTEVAQHPGRLAAVALLYLIAAGTSVSIAIALYRPLKKINASFALGSVVFRTIEAVFYAAAVVSLLSVLHLGQKLDRAPAEDAAAIQAIADSLLSMRDLFTLVGVSAFCVGALLYYALLYRSRLIPRWLSAWGVAATLVMLSACGLALFNGRPVTGYTFLILPIAVQELVLAVWLLAKGFIALPQAFSPSTDGSTVLNGPTETVVT
jgi:hypothetical protein